MIQGPGRQAYGHAGDTPDTAREPPTDRRARSRPSQRLCVFDRVTGPGVEPHGQGLINNENALEVHDDRPSEL
jgi:hypothetical protein